MNLSYEPENIMPFCTYSKIFEIKNNFLKGCKWSPSGLDFITNDSSNTLRLFQLTNNSNEQNYEQSIGQFDITLSVKPGGIIYDFEWGPPITDTSEHSLITVGNLGPIHIWDIHKGEKRGSYIMKDDKDEVVNAISVTYSSDKKIYAGTTGSVYMFDVERPGTNCYMLKNKYFKRGIVSSIAVNPIRPALFAIGTYNKQIGLYDEGTLLCTLSGFRKGVTHLRFSPEGTLLYSGMRGNGDIICWDLRNPGVALYKMTRQVNTQQRIYFELTDDGQYVISGSTDGKVFIWDTKGELVNETLLPIKEFFAHLDCTNSISINSKLSILATGSGQYHCKFPSIYDDSDNDDDGDRKEHSPILAKDYSVKLWSLKDVLPVR